jgi:hypothetical protein
VQRSISVPRGVSVSEDGEKRSFTINPAVTPSSDQILAHIAITRVECYNCIYSITSDFIDCEYVLVNTGTSTSTYLALTLTPAQYSVSDITNVFTAGLGSRLSFTYNSNAYMFTMEVDDATTCTCI